MNVKLNIKALREQRGLTQCQLADRVKVHQAKISLYERGKKMPHVSLLPRLAAALEVGIGDLFSIN